MKYFKPLCFISYIGLISCSTTSIDDQTTSEQATNFKPEHSVSYESHTHGAYHWFPEKLVCNAVKNAPETIEGYHPIYATTTFPSPYERPLRRGYDKELKPFENLYQKLSSGKIYGYRPSGFKPRDSFVYKRCMTSEQKALVDNFVDTMRHCNSGNFDIYIEKLGAGLHIQGDNGRNCQALGNALISAHLQGYQPNFLDKVNSLVGSGNTGAIIEAFDRCADANKRFDMSYQDDKLIFTCQDETPPLSLLNETHQ